MMSTTTLQELYNLRRYITHVMNESEYDPDDPEFHNPLSDHNWLKQTGENSQNMSFIFYQIV